MENLTVALTHDRPPSIGDRCNGYVPQRVPSNGFMMPWSYRDFVVRQSKS
jgi:hypothetical protein